MRRTLTALVAALIVICGATFKAPGAQAGPQEGAGGSVSLSNQSGKVSVRLERGSRVAVSNRYGRITITGWDRDTVEATATSARGAEAIQVEMTADPQARSALALAVVGRARMPGYVYVPRNANPDPNPHPEPGGADDKTREKIREQVLKDVEKQKEKIKEAAERGVILIPMPNVVVEPGEVVVTRPPRPPQPARAPSGTTPGAAGGTARREDGSITLDVKVPRYAQLDTIEVRAGDLTVSNLDGPVSVVSGSGNVNVSRVGSLELRSRSGNVTVEDVDGIVYVVATGGNINVRRSGGDVRATAISGNITVQCAKGRVDVSNTHGTIVLSNVGGDVEATGTEANINFTGPITNNGRYRLKTMEGRVVMAIPEGSPGFTATLMSYNGQALTDFPAERDAGVMQGRREVRHGDGQARITLDSFSQPVQLTRSAPGATAPCQ